MYKIAVLFSGEGSNLEYILNRMHNKEVEVALTITNNPDARGIRFAKEHGVELVIIDSRHYTSREEFDAQLVSTILKHDIDLTVLAGFMRILTPVFTDHIKAINLHPSLLPRHKGLDAIKKSYEDEYETGGVTTHHVTSELDGGDIIMQREISKNGLDFEGYHDEIKSTEKEILRLSIMQLLRGSL